MRAPDFGLVRPSVIGRVPTLVWVALLLASSLWLLGPRASGWQLLHVHKEDGSIFLQEWVRLGWSSFWEPYTGYQHLAPRSVTAACASGPASWFAPCVGAGAGLVRVAVALVASAVLVPYARTRAWGISAGFLFVFVPVGQQEALGNLTNLRWFLDAGALLVCLGLFPRRMGVLAGAVGLLGALSDPLVILLMPLALWRLASAPRTRMALPAAAVAVGGVAHWLVLVPAARPMDVEWFARAPAEALAQIAVRGGAVAQLGQNGTELLLMLAIPCAVLGGLIPLALVVMSRVTGGPAVLVSLLLVAGYGVTACTLVFAPREELELSPAWQLGNGSRYSVAPSILIGSAILVAASYAIPAAARWLAPLLLMLGAAADLTGDSWNSHGPEWASSVAAARSECQEGADVVLVQVTPTDVPTPWMTEVSCRWLAEH